MLSSIIVRKIISVGDMLANLVLIQQLIPELTEERYQYLLELMVPHNYFQVAAYEGDKCIGVSGYWICAKIYAGKYIEIDNFVVDRDFRSKGVGKVLLDWILEEGYRNHCDIAMLDAYVQNLKAHAFYNKQGFVKEGFHYLKALR